MPDSRRHIKHVALAEQRLGAHLIEDGTRVDLACDLKRDARWNVCLDEPGNHVDRWTLRREDQMDSRGTCLLRDAGDQLLDLLSGHHHEIGKLVDDDHDQRHFLDRFRRLGRQRERIGQRLARLFRFGDARVVTGEVAHAERGHQPVATLHFAHAPVERVGCELDIGDDGGKQVWNSLVHRKLEHLGIDQYQPHLPRLRFVEQR